MAMNTRKKRFAFVTIGQTPRTDLVPEMAAWIGTGADIVEFGALDGVPASEISALGPGPEDERLVTRLRDGSQVVVAKTWVEERLRSFLTELAGEDFFALVLLCTGYLPGLRVECLVLEAQAIVDHGVAALAHGARSVGVMVPLEKQIHELHFRPRSDQKLITSHASPYEPERLEVAAGELAEADLVIMHCMGYTEEMRRDAARVCRKPVLLARRMVASAVEQLL
jgi:protein AroM